MTDVPVIAQKAPFTVELTEGKTYFWCACGQSARQPFCDGSHKTTSFTPKSFVAEKTGTAWLCGCKHTGNAPFCDGTHKSLA
jgi:CDGSH-type Zn-finger protein